jgi:hypothetical protein
VLNLFFCGYILLNADKITNLKGAPYLFLACGLAAIFGLIWRFCYNITNHYAAHVDAQKPSDPSDQRCHTITKYWQSKLHNAFVVLSILSLFWALIAGCIYLATYPSLAGDQYKCAKPAQSSPASISAIPAVTPLPTKSK